MQAAISRVLHERAARPGVAIEIILAQDQGNLVSRLARIYLGSRVYLHEILSG